MASKKPVPAKKAAAKAGRKPVSQDKISAYGLDKICADVIQGETLTAIANKIGVVVASFLIWIDAESERSARIDEARKKSARIWDEKALDGIEGAKDAFALAKAREVAHHLRWRASKIAPRVYGEKIQHGGAEDLPPVRQQIDLNMTPADAYKATLGG